MIWFVLLYAIGCIAAASWVICRQSDVLKKQKASAKSLANMVHETEALNDKLKTEHAQKIAAQRREYEDKLHEKDTRVQKIIGELSHVQWRRDLRDREQYMVTITVCPRLFGGQFIRDDLIYIAKHIGDQVSHELASYKYIEKANEYERRYGR